MNLNANIPGNISPIIGTFQYPLYSKLKPVNRLCGRPMTTVCSLAAPFKVMYRPTEDHDDLLNSNYLHKKEGDESPTIVRGAHRSASFDDLEIQLTSEKPMHSSLSALSKREKLLIAGIVLLTVLLIVFIVLFAKAGKGKHREESKPSKVSIILAAGKFIGIL